MDEVREHYRAQFQERLATMVRGATNTEKIRRLLPLLESYFADGGTHQMAVEDLEKLGLKISRTVFTVTLYRIRSKQESVDASKGGMKSDKKEVSVVQAKKHAKQRKKIESPADLHAIRDLHFDLEALRQEELARRRAKKDN